MTPTCPFIDRVASIATRIAEHEGAIGDFICLDQPDHEAFHHAWSCDVCRPVIANECGSELRDPLTGSIRRCILQRGHERRGDSPARECHSDGSMCWQQDEGGLMMFLDPRRVTYLIPEGVELTPFRDVKTATSIDWNQAMTDNTSMQSCPGGWGEGSHVLATGPMDDIPMRRKCQLPRGHAGPHGPVKP